MPTTKLPPETHDYIRRGYEVLHLNADDLALMFGISRARVYQILCYAQRLKIDGKWVIRKGRNL